MEWEDPMATVRITVVVENTASRSDLQAEHGLSLWIDTGHHRVLFDTGQGGLVVANAKVLGLPLESADAVVLSHGHYDHTGGLCHVLPLTRRARVHLHPAALSVKYAREGDGRCRSIGIPESSREALSRHAAGTVHTTGVTEVVDGLFVTGEVPRVSDFEDTGGPFYLDNAATQPDPILDDQSLFFDTPQGVVVALGCAHAGVINVLEHVRRATGRPIHTVFGGTHLVSASEERLGRTIESLRRLGVRRLGPAHCTGSKATAGLWQALPDCCFACPGGTELAFDR